MIYELSFRGNGGSVVPGRLQAMSAAPQPALSLALVSCSQVTFIIHGFNVEEQAGRKSLRKLAEELDPVDPNGAVVYVLWPGDSPIGALSYPFTEGAQANDTALELSRFIEAQVGSTVKLNFVAHSLGCRVTLEAVRRLYLMADGEADEYPVSQVCLFAAAVDDFNLSLPDCYKKPIERAARVVVLSSVKDKVLKYAYPIGDLVQSFVYFLKDTAGLALGYHGPKPLKRKRRRGRRRYLKVLHAPATNISAIAINKKDDVDHGDYLPTPKDKPSNKKQQAAARLAIAALSGHEELTYKL